MPDEVTTLLLSSLDTQIHELKVILILILSVILAIGAMIAPSTAYALVFVIGEGVTAGLLVREFYTQKGDGDEI